MPRLIVLFQSTHSAIRAERLCIKHSLPCSVIAVPRSISSECGIALEITESNEQPLFNLLTENKIQFIIQRLP